MYCTGKYIHSPHGGSAQCLGAHKSSLPFCLQFQQDIYTCKSTIASLPRSVNTLCPQICVCWMSLRSQHLWPLPAVHPKPGRPAELWTLGLNLIPFCSSCILPIFGRAWAQEDYFLLSHSSVSYVMSLLQRRELGQRARSLRRALQDNVANTIVMLLTVWSYPTQHVETVAQAAGRKICGNSSWSSDC